MGRDRRQRRRRAAVIGGAAIAAKKHHDAKEAEAAQPQTLRLRALLSREASHSRPAG